MEERIAQLEEDLRITRNDVLSLRIERRGLMFALMAIISTHPRHADCQFLMDYFLNSHLENSETGKVLPDVAKEHLREFVRSLQDAADHQDPEAVRGLRAKLFPWEGERG